MTIRADQRLPGGLVAGFGLVLGLAGCSGITERVAVGTMTDVVEEATTVAWASDDPELVRDAVPANLLLLEGLIQTRASDELRVLAAQFYFSYGFGFVEDEDPGRAAALYARGRDHGRRVLADRTPALGRALEAADLDAVERALDRLDEEAVPALFWTTAAWAAWINLSLESPAAIADLPIVEAMLERTIELDAAYQWGMPHLMMGAYYAGRPRLLGGDPVRGLEHFERARQISGGRLALASLFEARYYAVQTLDEPLFERRLEEVLETSPDALPEARLLNLIAREKARALLAAREDIF